MREGVSGYSKKGQPQTMIFLEGQHRIKFGWGLNAQRRYFMVKALEEVLEKIKTNNSLF